MVIAAAGRRGWISRVSLEVNSNSSRGYVVADCRVGVAGGFSLRKISTGSVVVSREMSVKAYRIGGSELISWKVCDRLFKCNEMWRDIGRGIFGYLKLGE